MIVFVLSLSKSHSDLGLLYLLYLLLHSLFNAEGIYGNQFA